MLCARVERILAPQRRLELEACCPAVEDEAQRSAAQLVQAGVSPVGPAVAWKRQPLEGSGATHPGVHGLRTSSVGWDAERLWRTCVTPTDLEAVLRSLGSALGPRPIHHRRPARSAGHLCLSVLACQLVPVVRQRLRAGGVRKLLVQLRRRRKSARNVVPHA